VKGDGILSPMKGQKIKDDPINKLVHFRINDETNKQLEFVSQKNNVSKSEVIRKGIEIQYKELKEKE
jgi:predicted DNA-binding protein